MELNMGEWDSTWGMELNMGEWNSVIAQLAAKYISTLLTRKFTENVIFHIQLN